VSIQKPRYSEQMECGVLYFVVSGEAHSERYGIKNGIKSTKSTTSPRSLKLSCSVTLPELLSLYVDGVPPSRNLSLYWPPLCLSEKVIVVQTTFSRRAEKAILYLNNYERVRSIRCRQSRTKIGTENHVRGMV